MDGLAASRTKPLPPEIAPATNAQTVHEFLTVEFLTVPRRAGVVAPAPACYLFVSAEFLRHPEAPITT